MTKNTLLIFAGITTLIQGCIQFVLTGLALAQYFCFIDLLRELPVLLYIRILYFHNPVCGTRVTIGQAIDGMPNQAFVLLISQSVPTFRTFLINAVYFGLSIVWITTSGVMIYGGAKNNRSAHVRWPWMAVMVLTFGLDICATVAYITDTFHTRTLAELVDFISGTLSGTGNQTVDTSWVPWIMVMIYSRFGVTVLLNVFLVVCTLVDCGHRGNFYEDEESMKEIDEAGSDLGTRIPRVSILRHMPSWLSKPVSPKFYRRPPSPDPHANSEREPTPPMRAAISATTATNNTSSSPVQADVERKHTVNFPKNLLSLPQRLENMIAEQQKRLNMAVVDTSGRSSPPRTSQSLPQLNEESIYSAQVDAKGRRGTAVELHGQLPWSYIPPAAHRMRDQLPPDEELPPVPVPDYTLHPKYRKASVHRAGSNVSVGGYPHREFIRSSPLPRSQQIMEADVLY